MEQAAEGVRALGSFFAQAAMGGAEVCCIPLIIIVTFGRPWLPLLSSSRSGATRSVKRAGSCGTLMVSGSVRCNVFLLQSVCTPRLHFQGTAPGPSASTLFPVTHIYQKLASLMPSAAPPGSACCMPP